MSAPTTYLEVAVAAPIHQTLTYAPPPDAATLLPGQRLLVPLGNRQVTGYLLGFAEAPPEGTTAKAASEVLDQAPLFPANMIPFFRWISRYYHHPLGEVIKTALPGGLTRQSKRQLVLAEAGRAPVADFHAKEGGPTWLADLLAHGSLTPAATAKVLTGPEKKLCTQWLRNGWLELATVVSEESSRAKTEVVVQMVARSEGPSPKLKPSEQKTLDLLNALTTSEPRAIPRRELTREYPGAGPALKTLAEKGLVVLEERRLFRDPFGEPPPFFPPPVQLTDEQQTALAAILPEIEARRFAPFLLHGVTGSGKTEVYLQAAEATLAQGRQVLVLVPEIALATQLEAHFYSRFGEQVALIHSGLSSGERFDQWSRIASGEARVVIGARSALFAPLPGPGLIIVDEEHDSAYKQEDGLRYHGRDLALLRGSMQQAVVLLGSATPAITTFHQAQSSKFRLLTLSKRVEERPLPEVEIVDLQAIKTVSGRPPLFSPQLTQALRRNFAAGQQSLLFLNRRGFANLMLCQECGQTMQCRHCQVSLTFHKGRKELLCHYCGYASRADIVCPNCRSGSLVPVGFGTERIEAELRELLPKARIARLDRDTTQNRRDFLAILKAVHAGEIDILVGTQMITKGHHFPRVTLVGIVWADAGLGIPDFRSGERTFQLLAQVTGRAGRGEEKGRVIVQTHQPNHYSVALAQAHDYQGLYDKEIALRQRLGYPPFSRLINLRLEGENEAQVRAFAEQLGTTARKKAAGKVEVLGPVPAPLARIRNHYRWQLLLKGAPIEALHALCQHLLDLSPQRAGSTAVKLTLDVDPENML
jgi:primosomal protein N' (replication factor Y)